MFDQDGDDYRPRLRVIRTQTSDDEMTVGARMSTMSMATYKGKVAEYVEKHDQLDGFDTYPGADRIDYDFVYERNNVFSTNLVESTAHLIKGCLGIGILAMPEAFMNGGLWTSLGLSIFFGLLAIYTMLILGKSAQTMYSRVRIPKLSYSDLVEISIATGPIKRIRNYSKPFRYILDAVLLFQLCSTCSIYQIVMAKTFKQVLEFFSEAMQESKIHLRFYILFLTIPLLLLCSIRNIKYLAPLSMAGDIFLVICIGAALYYNVLQAESIWKRPAWKSVEGMYQFLGVLFYSVDGFCVALSVENNMTDPMYYPCVVWSAMSIALSLMTIVGFFGYLGCRETCRSPLTLHMPDNEIAPILLQFLLTVAFAFTFAIHFWVPFRIIWRYIGQNISRKRGVWERFFRCIHVLVITCISLSIPNIYRFITFMGTVILSIIMFILPPLVENLVIWREKQRRFRRLKLCFNNFIAILGFIVFGGGIYFCKNPLK